MVCKAENDTIDALTVCCIQIDKAKKHTAEIRSDIQLIVIAIELRHIFACDVNLDAFIILILVIWWPHMRNSGWLPCVMQFRLFFHFIYRNDGNVVPSSKKTI